MFGSGSKTITNSTLSGNTAFDRGGGVFNAPFGILTITDSTLSGNFAHSAEGGGGVLNDHFATLTLARTMVSGNTAPNGPEIYNAPYDVECDYYGCSYLAPGVVYADNFNLFGHDGIAGAGGFTPGATDIVPAAPLNTILNLTLADNGGPTLTHAIVSGSPAVDAVTTGCPPPNIDQHGFLRPAEGDSIPGAFCDIGSFEFNATPAALEVTFDIKPGSFPNTINPTSNGVIAVAILTTPDLDATTVDPLSVEFGPEGAPEAHGKGHREDVNGDGIPDLLLHFRTQETGIECGDTSVSFTGETVQGEQIQGADAITTVGCKKP